MSEDEWMVFRERVFDTIKRIHEEREQLRRLIAEDPSSPLDLTDPVAAHPQHVCKEIFGLFEAPTAEQEAGRRALITRAIKSLLRDGRVETFPAVAYLDLNSFDDHHFGVAGHRRRISCYRPSSLLTALAAAANRPAARRPKRISDDDGAPSRKSSPT